MQLNQWMKKRQLRRIFLSLLGGFLTVLAIAWFQVPAIAQINQATIQEIIDGDQVFIEDIPAEVDAVANFQQEVSTKESRAALLFNNNAAGRLGPNSEITVGQCIEVKQGSLLASGPANGCTANFDIGVQGTVYVLEANEEGESRVKVLEGEVQVTSKQQQETQAVGQGKVLAVSPNGRLGKPTPLSQEEVEAILNGVLFNGFDLELPGMSDLQSALKSLYPNINLPRLPGFNLPVPRPPRLPGPRLPF